MDHQKHTPVLLDEVLKLLSPKAGDRYLDLTAGYGGHAEAIAKRIGNKGSLTLVDRDEFAASHLKKLFGKDDKTKVIADDFLSASKVLIEQNGKFELILADLGVSSVHFNDAERGFSFRMSGPLDMRMDRRLKKTAGDIVNEASEQELARIFRDYGEIKNSQKLAKKIVQNRPFKTTTELADVVSAVQPGRRLKIHPATQVFQALRIAVNDELGQLEQSLPIWIDLLAAGGKLGVISFHSLEDRLVKRAFQSFGGKRYDATLQTVTKRPVTASVNEVVFNPRARSALLRVAQRK